VAGGFLRTEMIDRDSIVPHRDVEASSQRPRLIILSTGGTIAFYLPSGMAPPAGYRHGHRERQLMGTFGPVTVRVPRARLEAPDGKTAEWKNATIPAYQRRTKQADALIAGAYLSGTNTRRVRRALTALFGGAVGKDTVSRVWRKVKGDWDAWNARSLAAEPIIHLILDGTVVRVRLDKKSTSISLLVALGVRQDGQKVLLAVKDMSGESEAAWRALLDDLVKRGLKTPELIIVDGAPGLEKALAALWFNVAVQRCTVHKHRNLLAHAPDRLHDELSADYKDMIYADTKPEIEAKRKAFVRKWRLKCPAAAASLEQATSCSPSPASRKANGNRSEPRMRSSDCTKSSNGGSRPRPCCPRRKQQPCCLGFAGFWPDHNAQGGRLANPQRKAIRSDD
jgi:putative transposase